MKLYTDFPLCIILFIIISDAYASLYRKKRTEGHDVINSKKVEISSNYLKSIDNGSNLMEIKKKSAALRGKNDFGMGFTGNPMYRRKGLEGTEDGEGYRKDLILNYLAKRRGADDSDYVSSSSSLELKNWKDEWKEVWLKKKLEALNATIPVGDDVNMVAARPWGVQCGDPNQHDMPWGTCMLPMECEAEFRIYRGDHFCGRTQFVCCAIQLNSYDMYQGFDVSFDASSFETDTEERKERDKTSREKRRKKKRRERRRRKRDRQKRKRKIKKNIRKIIKEIRKILNRSYRNGTSVRKKKTKQLKKFVKALKKQYRKDRQSVKDIHEREMIKVDVNLMKKLNEIRAVNNNFVRNSTFRDIVMNGTMNKSQARMLVEAYPELESWLKMRRNNPLDLEEDYLDENFEYG